MTTTINVFNAPDATVPQDPQSSSSTQPAARSLQERRVQALSGDRQRSPLRAEYPAAGGDALTATIRLYDCIDSWGMFFGISAREFAEVLDALPSTVTEIRLLINSPGGECTEGFAILNLLRNHPARVLGVVEGLAASAASFIAAGCDELQMNPNSELLIHDAWGVAVGPAADLRELADTLDHLSDNIASVYAAKAGGTVADWRAVMAIDTWYSADDAVAAGLADSVTAPSADDGKPAARIDHSIFNSAGRPAPERKTPDDRPAIGSSATTEGGPAVALSDEQYTNLREKLGADADADGDSILAAIDDLLEQATAPPPPVTEDAAPALPEGVVAISEAKLTELRNDAQAGREARDAQLKAERESLVKAAVADGRIAPAEKQAWLDKLETGTGAETVLAALKPGVVPVDQIGHGGNADLDSDEAIWSELFGKEVTA